jgi:hypothetical protein
MHLTSVYGSYVPSYLLIKLQTEMPLNDIAVLGLEDQRTFFHEYIHFLQNITGGFGHSHIWNTYDRLRQVVSEIQKAPEPVLSLPVRNAVTEEQEKLLRIMQAISGSYKVSTALNDNSTIVRNVEEYRDPNYDERYPGAKTNFIQLDLQDTSKRISSYFFGESAVSETMTYLLEKKMFGEKKLGNYPYEACQRLCDYIGTTLHHNDECLFTLCDVAMLSAYPGRMFYVLVTELHEIGYKQESAEKLFDKCLGIMYRHHWNIWQDFETAMKGASHVIGALFYHGEFVPTLKWIQYILQRGYEYRRENRFFMLELYRAASPYVGKWVEINQEFGTPQLHNAKYKRYFRAPAPLKPIEEQIEPLWLLSLQQVHDTLVHRKVKCGLYEVCDNLDTGSVTDYDCVTQPWERAKRKPLCAYAAIWTVFKLTEKEVKYGPE